MPFASEGVGEISSRLDPSRFRQLSSSNSELMVLSLPVASHSSRRENYNEKTLASGNGNKSVQLYGYDYRFIPRSFPPVFFNSTV